MGADGVAQLVELSAPSNSALQRKTNVSMPTYSTKRLSMISVMWTVWSWCSLSSKRKRSGWKLAVCIAAGKHLHGKVPVRHSVRLLSGTFVYYSMRRGNLQALL